MICSVITVTQTVTQTWPGGLLLSAVMGSDTVKTNTVLLPGRL